MSDDRSIRSVALTPTTFLRRSAAVYPDRRAVIDGDRQWSYSQLLERSERLAGGLAQLGVQPGDRVAVLAPNSSTVLEAHHGVPFAGAVLVALNTRLAAPELGFILGHSGARVLLVDASLAGLAADAVAATGAPVSVVTAGGDADDEYERLLATADRMVRHVDDEHGLLALNYTSGTTGVPKGVRYHHRGAYLQALAMAFHSQLGPSSTFLWTLPMFHCNGWCYTWAVTASGGTHRCLRSIDPEAIWAAIEHEGVTHLNAAPTVLTMIAANAPGCAPRTVKVATGGAPPSPALLDRTAELGLDVTHLYGMTETFGPSVVCDWHPEWDARPRHEQAVLKARQGVPNVLGGELRVIDEHGWDVPSDGTTLGQMALRGNTVTDGYYRDPEATAAAFLDDWFLTGDLAVRHADGYVELKDRAKDIIISGGENISTVEVEQALSSHPGVAEAAVVGADDELWGQVPVAHVSLFPNAVVSVDELRQHVRARLAGFKVPKRVTFGQLPKTATGKIQKYRLRDDEARRGGES